MHYTNGRDVNNHKIPQVQDLENSLYQDRGSNNEQIVLEKEVIDISAPQGTEIT